MGIKLKQSPSGKELVGTADGQSLVWNNTLQEWTNSAGSVVTTKRCYVDVTTTVPTAQQDGSLFNPFGSMQQAWDYFPAGASPGGASASYGTIIVLQGNPSPGSQNFITSTVADWKFLAVVAISVDTVYNIINTGIMACGQLVVSNHAEIWLQGLHWEDIAAFTCRVSGQNTSIGNFADDGGASFKFASTFPHAVGSGDEHPTLGNVTAANIQIRGYDCTGNLHATTNDGRNMIIEGCEVRGNVTNDFNTLYIDRYSMVSARRNAKTIASPTISSLDEPFTLGTVFAVGALAGTFADVTVALAGARPRDTFSVSPVPGTILANVAPVAAWCPANNQITVRFFGTTAGGNYSLDINTNVNSGN